MLVSIDTLRPDHLGAYGYPRDTSPRFDALAKEGVLFENAFAPSSWTLPSHASMLSGESPFVHGAVSKDEAIRDGVPLLAEMLKERGYTTVGLVSGPFVGARYGFTRGFDRFTERFRRRRVNDAFHAEVLAAVDALPKERFFLFAHYFDVHHPYDPPPEYDRFRTDPSLPRDKRDGRAMRLQRLLEEGRIEIGPRQRDRLVDLYDGGILAMDAKLGELVDRVRAHADGNVVVIVTSDHGEEFLEHGGLMHSKTLYDEVLRVPLVVAGPDVRRGARVPSMVSLLDVTPTILSLAGASGSRTFAGRSLRLFLEGETREPAQDPQLPLLTLGHDRELALRGFRTKADKLILDLASGRGELYDLRSDPREKQNLYPDERSAALEPALRALEIAEAPRLPKADPETVELLRSLGYL